MRKLVRITSANRYKIFVTSDKGCVISPLDCSLLTEDMASAGKCEPSGVCTVKMSAAVVSSFDPMLEREVINHFASMPNKNYLPPGAFT